MSTFSTILEAKRFELLIELVPSASKIALLFDPNFWTANLTLSAITGSSRFLNRNLQVLPINNDAELDVVLTTMSRTDFDAAIISAGPFFYNRRVYELHSFDVRLRQELTGPHSLLHPRRSMDTKTAGGACVGLAR